MIHGRRLSRDEIGCVWSIDRSEVIDTVYHLAHGALVLRPEHYDVRGWPPGEAEKYIPILEACFDSGGWFYGLFDAGRLIAAAVLDGRIIGNADQLQLEFLHVSRAYRGQGFGRQLFDLARAEASQRGARRLYISATPSQHTIDFYLSLGCRLTEPDPRLLELEPDDIHLECAVTKGEA